MGDIVELKNRNFPADLNSDLGHQWVSDCCRAGEGIIDDAELSAKWELTDADWRVIRKDKALERAVRLERERRVRTGLAVREAAARHLIKGVGIVDQIMSSAESHPKHKLDAYRELRSTAAGGVDGEGRQDNSRFVITIVMNTDEPEGNVVEHYDKPIEINPDPDHNDISINVDEGHGKD